MLNSKNFMPMFEDTISGGMAQVLATTVPSSVNAAKKADAMFSWKESAEVALEMEKVATKLNGPTWHELSAMLNLKHRLDKLAYEIEQGNHLYQGHEVFEKVASFKELIEKQAAQLIDFNRKQQLRTNSYLVRPSHVKQAVAQLDGLYRYASFGKKKDLEKEAGLFQPSQALSDASKYVSNMSKQVRQLQVNFDNANASLRAVMHEGSDSPAVKQALSNVQKAEEDLNKGVEELKNLHSNHGDIKQSESMKNIGIASAVGVPGLVGLGYSNEALKDGQ
jgi:hypothetical protein